MRFLIENSPIFIGRYWGLFLVWNLMRFHASLLVKAGNSSQSEKTFSVFSWEIHFVPLTHRQLLPPRYFLGAVYLRLRDPWSSWFPRFPENSTDPRNYLQKIPEEFCERFVPNLFVRFWSRKATLGFSFDRRSREPAHESRNHLILIFLLRDSLFNGKFSGVLFFSEYF